MKSDYLRFREIVGLLVFCAIAPVMTGCDGNQDIKNWIENTDKLRMTAKQQGDVVPYRKEQFDALKTYFNEMNQVALSLKNDPKFAERFNGAVGQSDLRETCAKVFLTRDEWQIMMERCRRNNFFLCAEEVRAYPDMVSVMRGSLVAEEQRRFDQTPACVAAL